MNHKLCEELKPAEKILSKYEKNTFNSNSWSLFLCFPKCFGIFARAWERWDFTAQWSAGTAHAHLRALRMRTWHSACAPLTHCLTTPASWQLANPNHTKTTLSTSVVTRWWRIPGHDVSGASWLHGVGDDLAHLVPGVVAGHAAPCRAIVGLAGRLGHARVCCYATRKKQKSCFESDICETLWE